MPDFNQQRSTAGLREDERPSRISRAVRHTGETAIGITQEHVEFGVARTIAGPTHGRLAAFAAVRAPAGTRNTRSRVETHACTTPWVWVSNGGKAHAIPPAVSAPTMNAATPTRTRVTRILIPRHSIHGAATRPTRS